MILLDFQAIAAILDLTVMPGTQTVARRPETGATGDRRDTDGYDLSSSPPSLYVDKFTILKREQAEHVFKFQSI
ncbi:hypothetical protein FJ951_07135 [Mesorhizobium sp. B2-2-3]|uniref:hypothetical protein n=1 Tax=Mesorhizobium sp. B2-2-3 TaxID=2589963 RepID=UPI00112B593D|nr:hypothetical protein [Mesorhizobium sp. B2-2-3]TPM51574.1 hypothetical protein FJ951_07135 [Mesorhizobium sp. B2-2-3]